MAHGTHNDANPERSKSIVSFKSSFWLVVILVGLFVAALNFIKVVGDSKKEEGGEKTEKPAEAATPEAEKVKEAKGEAPATATPATAPAPEHK